MANQHRRLYRTEQIVCCCFWRPGWLPHQRLPTASADRGTRSVAEDSCSIGLLKSGLVAAPRSFAAGCRSGQEKTKWPACVGVEAPLSPFGTTPPPSTQQRRSFKRWEYPHLFSRLPLQPHPPPVVPVSSWGWFILGLDGLTWNPRELVGSPGGQLFPSGGGGDARYL